MKTLQGKTVLVTGGSRGIGAAVALALAKVGADVAINYRARTDEAEKVCAEIRKMGRRALAVKADVSKSPEVAGMVSQIKQEFGDVNILVNNAGMMRVRKPEEITEADWDEHINVNLKSAFLVTQAVLPQMRAQRWGRIINISSVAAQVGGLVGPHYAASKAGLLGLIRTAANELGPYGIRVNAVCPGLIRTRLTQAHFSNPDLLKDPKRSLLASYLQGNTTVFRCPGDKRVGLYQGSDPAYIGTTVRKPLCSRRAPCAFSMPLFRR